MTTLHRGPRNSNPLEAVAQRRHAELDAQFDEKVLVTPEVRERYIALMEKHGVPRDYWPDD